MVNLSVPIFIFDDHGYTVAYCPVLNLSSYGSGEDDALRAFDEEFEIFIESTVSSGTILQYLAKHGWTIEKNSFGSPAIETNLLPSKRSTFIKREIEIPTS